MVTMLKVDSGEGISLPNVSRARTEISKICPAIGLGGVAVTTLLTKDAEAIFT